jgi:hypothetical protein
MDHTSWPDVAMAVVFFGGMALIIWVGSKW